MTDTTAPGGQASGPQAIEISRKEIDALDRQIVALLARRTALVAQLTEHKTDEAAVRSPDRVQLVLEKVRGLAEECGMPAPVAVATYRTLINELTEMQLQRLHERRRQGLIP